MKSGLWKLLVAVVILVMLAGCGAPTPEKIERVVTQVVEKVVTQIVKETVIVEGTPQVIEKEVTIIVEKEVPKSSAAPRLNCSPPFSPQLPIEGEYTKPAIPLRNLPRPDEPLLVNEGRVIGFAFADGWIGLGATPARAQCTFDDPSLGTAVGVVWTFVEADNPKTYVVSIVLDSGEGFLFNEKLEDPIPVSFSSTSLQSQGGIGIPSQEGDTIDVTIRAGSVCFRVGETRYCSQADQLSVRSLFNQIYADQVQKKIADARDVLVDARIPIDEQVLYDLAISEIEDPERIKTCMPTEPGTCQADIAVAPIAAAHNSLVNLAILAVTQDLTDLPDDAFLEAGSYVVHVETDDETGEVILPAMVSGVTDAGGIIDFQPIPTVLAPFVDETGDLNIAEISGCKIWKICFFWECR